MALKRVIPCLLYDGKGLVKTVRFKKPSYVGDPINAVKIFNEKEVDELILLDIAASRQKRGPNFSVIADIAGEAFMPFTYGGGVSTYDDFSRLFSLGVEKVVINSLLLTAPQVVKNVIREYGSQAIVASVDFGRNLFGKTKVISHVGYLIKSDINDYIKFVEELGVGEIMLQSVERDGTWLGYEFNVIREIANATTLPVIAAGGCGSCEDIKRVLYETGASAAAVGSMAVYSKKGMGVLINFPSRELVISDKL